MSLQPHIFDRSKIDKVILNLLSNAIKFTPSGGKITMRVWDETSPNPLLSKERVAGGRVRSEEEGGALKISIADTGIGIPADKVNQVFDRFMQVDTSSTRAYSGMGIGLSLVKDFVELHGGTIEVESTLGKGTKFTITLPRGKEHFKGMVEESPLSTRGRGAGGEGEDSDLAASRAAIIESMREIKWEDEEDNPLPLRERDTASAKTAGGEGEETVLVVDDNADMRRTLREILKEKFRVIFAKDGEEGIRVASEKLPDLVLSDVMMPKKDGYTLLRELKNDPKTSAIPVILLTAKSGEENLVLGFQTGADDYIQKPFSSKEVLARVKNLIRIRRQAEQITTQAEQILKITSQVAHDIRSPLSSIRAVIGQLRESSVRDQDGDYLNLLELSARRLSGIAEDLLRNGEARSEKIVFSLHKVLDELIGESASSKKMKGIRIKKDFGHAVNCIGHRDRVQRALGNILNNAVEAIKGDGEIFVKTEIQNGWVTVSIRDTGCGMTPEVFRQLLSGGSYSGKGGGHGIGMKVVREVVKEHGWRLEGESVPGQARDDFSDSTPDLGFQGFQGGQGCLSDGGGGRGV